MSVELEVIKECLKLHEFVADDFNAPPSFEKVLYVSGEQFGIPTFCLLKRNEDYYVAIRGAISQNDILIALDLERVEYMDGTVHRGAYSGAKGIYDRIIDKIRECKGRVVCTGHSLGGAVSALLAILINFETEVSAVAVSLAPFPVLSPSVAELTESFITSFVYNNDPFPLLTASNSKTFLKILGVNLEDASSVDSSSYLGMAIGLIQQASNNYGIQVDLGELRERIISSVKSVVSITSRNLEEFYVPGTCYHFIRDAGTGQCKVYGFVQGRELDLPLLLCAQTEHATSLYISVISNWDGKC